MSEQVPQSFEKHTRLDPAFHFFLVPAAAGVFFTALFHAFRAPSFDTIWMAVLAFLFLFAVFMIRIYSLKVQNRVIRLEERLRFGALAEEPLKSRVPEITEGQWIALRFASDAELPQLAKRALDEKLAPKDIKKAIQQWRPDYYRV